MTTSKIYMRDTGLLMAMLVDGSQKDIIDGNLGIYKGAIYENIIAVITAHQVRIDGALGYNF